MMSGVYPLIVKEIFLQSLSSFVDVLHLGVAFVLTVLTAVVVAIVVLPSCGV